MLLPDHALPDRPLFAVYPPGRQPVRKVKVFLDFIQAWFREHPILEPPAVPVVPPVPTQLPRRRVASGRAT